MKVKRSIQGSDPAKIGYYSRKTGINTNMTMQAAESVPVRYEAVHDWNRLGFMFTTEEDDLPKDPRQWSREDVARWLKQTTRDHDLPRVCPSRFHMNGKALCLMTLNMFLMRVPLGGKQLYKDFQLRLRTAMYSSN